jgi:LDH2 family malate/lactate/ureidoglycolate dehydrogenase
MFDDPSRPSWHNASFIAFDIGAMVPRAEFEQRLRTLIGEIHGAATAEGIERVLLPGEREWQRLRQAQLHGIDLPPDVNEKLKLVAASIGLAPP